MISHGTLWLNGDIYSSLSGYTLIHTTFLAFHYLDSPNCVPAILTAIAHIWEVSIWKRLLYIMTVLDIDRVSHYPRLIICIGTITMENPLLAVFPSFCHYFACLNLCRKVNKISVTQKKLLPLLNYQTTAWKSHSNPEQPLIIYRAKEKEACLEMNEPSLQFVCLWAHCMTSASNGCYETTAHKMATNTFNQLWSSTASPACKNATISCFHHFSFSLKMA